MLTEPITSDLHIIRGGHKLLCRCHDALKEKIEKSNIGKKYVECNSNLCFERCALIFLKSFFISLIFGTTPFINLWDHPPAVHSDLDHPIAASYLVDSLFGYSLQLHRGQRPELYIGVVPIVSGAGHATTLPRQRDHDFRPQHC